MSRLAALVTAAALALGAVASADPAAALLLDPSPPILTVSLTCADGGGATLHVQGAELFADRDVRVGRNEPGFQTYATGHTDTHGEFQATGFIPAHPVGFYDLTMQEADGPPDDLTWVDQDTASIYLQCPGVRVLPGQVAQRTGGLQLRVGAQGFYGYGSDVTFRLDGLPLGDPQPAATTGQVFETVTLPALPDCGSHVVTAEQPAYYYYADAISATTTFVVTCPTLTPDPSSVEKASLPRPVHVTGTGWDPGLDVQLAVDGVPGPIVHVDAGGALAGDVTLPVRPCGPVPVTGVQVWPPPITRATRVLVDSVTQPARAQTSVTVTCPAPVTPTPTVTPTPVDPPTPVDIPTPVSTPTPTPTETPTEVPPTASALLTVDLVLPSGGVGTAHGEGFAPGRLVTLRWVLPDGSTAPGTSSAVPDGAGRFAVPCLVLSHARLGPRSLQAVQPAPGGTRAATAATLVVNGPMEPGRSRLLGRR